MKSISLILLAAGESSRFGLDVKKQWLYIDDEPLWLYVANRYKNYANFDKIIIVGHKDELKYMQKFNDEFFYVEGGNMRQISLRNALCCVDSEFVTVCDVARANVSENLMKNLINACENSDCVSPYLKVADTTYQGENIIDRDSLKLIQTPQISRVKLLKKALQSDEIFTDDSAAIASVGGTLGFIDGEISAYKITKVEDLKFFDFNAPNADVFCGNGFDVHAMQNGEFITLCGVKIPCEYSLIAHSDGDVAIHALIDAICGAAGLGDIGELFPDTDDKYKGIDSKILLQNVVKRVRNFGFEVVNADITIIAQRPKLSTYKAQMQKNISEILMTKKVNVKATTTEKLGFTGRSEGIAVMANANLKYINWQKLCKF